MSNTVNNKEWDFNNITVTADVEKSTEETWAAIGDFAGAGKFLNVPSEMTAGSGAPGTIRLVGDGISEVLVGVSKHAYTYAQIIGPMTPFNYHGSVKLEALGETSCRIIYTLTYNHASFDETKKAEETARLTKRFQGMADAMKTVAESNKD